MHRSMAAWLTIAAFALSGAAGLVYEVVWTRTFARTLGVTSAANATVLAVYLGGLGVGAWLAGARIDKLARDRAARVYAALEAVVALCAIGSPWVIDALYRGWAALPLEPASFARTLSRPLVALLVLAVPTLAMGATLPALLRATSQLFSSSRAQLSGLYAANTLGAMLGSLGAGYVLVPRFGNATAIRLGSAGSIAAAILALLVARAAARAEGERDAGSSTPTPSSGEANSSDPRWIAALSFACGAMMLGGEVLWSRTLVTALGATIYAVSSVLAWVLAGLTLGAVSVRWMRWIERDEQAAGALRWAAALTALASIGSVHLGPWMAQWALRWGEAQALRGAWLPIAVTAPVALVPALFSGAAMPLAIRALGGGSSARASAIVYGANTLGCVLGSLIVGLWAIAAVGTRASSIALALLGLLVAVLAMARDERAASKRAAVLCAALGAGLAASAPSVDVRVWAGGTHMFPQQMRRLIAAEGFEARAAAGRVLYASEGAESTILVERLRNHRTFFVGGKPEASDDPEDMRNQYLLGHLPALLHGRPTRGLVVGFGSGMTAGALAVHSKVDVVDLSPPVRNAARIFADLNHGAADHPDITVHHEDGRAFLLSARRTWDVITVDPIHPYVAGAATLYTRDYFALVRSRLSRGGVAAHWLPLYQLRWEDVCGVLRSFGDVFADASVYLTGGDAILIGGAGESVADPERFRQGYSNPIVQQDLARVWLDTPERLAATSCCAGATLRRAVSWAQPITDDHTWIEFTAPSSAQRYTPDNVRFLSNLGAAIQAPSEAARRARATYHFILRAQLDRWAVQVDRATALAEFEAMFAADPSSVELRLHLEQRRAAPR